MKQSTVLATHCVFNEGVWFQGKNWRPKTCQLQCFLAEYDAELAQFLSYKQLWHFEVNLRAFVHRMPPAILFSLAQPSANATKKENPDELHR